MKRNTIVKKQMKLINEYSYFMRSSKIWKLHFFFGKIIDSLGDESFNSFQRLLFWIHYEVLNKLLRF